ncbi:16S rRNA (adenine(1518)-N(6)/adenine(1519)-N(6))-dimethyltransferase RsmA [Anaerovorax odorimutans]|uniref:16S rRNA (adenine(1518)-N(6)/adenine(1519)-N(6))- dimethyltransferase RsmA n=1 Tax=Anaerovorax odorimutans TaxID=109327 RepID=UPI0004101AB4|nr:16S rRNA (adenine(1518)-N(6)/adenine(1519)-N(6))-dimethyltransferase RsmA [Anaerovorax odorimutans]
MDKLYAPKTIKAIKDKHGFKLSKSLGQNFLTDKNIIEKIIEGSLICDKDLVIEIGPGVGVLTTFAAKEAAKVIAVEIDKNLIPILKETLKEYDNIEVINKDILKTNLSEIIEENKNQSISGVKIIGNLPYYITTPIIMKILEDGVEADSITIMLQKEVAERIKAAPGSRIYGAISVAVQYYCSVSHIANVPKEVFIPQPKVDSSVIRLDIRKEKPVNLISEKTFFNVIKSGFGQRRKTLLNSLTGIYGMSKEEILQILKASDIEPSRRAETLNITEFANIANEIDKKCKSFTD